MNEYRLKSVSGCCPVNLSVPLIATWTLIAYHGLGTGGNCVTYSSDPDLENWEKPKANPIVHPGWDPHMWLDRLNSGTESSCRIEYYGADVLQSTR